MSDLLHSMRGAVSLGCLLAVAILVGCAEKPAPKAKGKAEDKSAATKEAAPAKPEAPKTEDLIPEPPKNQSAKTEPGMTEDLVPEPPKNEAKTEEAKPEPAKTEEAKPEPPKEPAKTEEAKPEPPKTEPAKTEPPMKEEAKPEPPKEPAKTEEAKPEPPKTEPAKTEPPMKEEAKPEPPKEPAKIDEAKPEPPKEPAKTEEPKPEPPKEPAKTDEPKPEPPKSEPAADSPKALGKAELLVELPDSCNTPDGMTLLSDESVIVSVPNFNDQKQPPLLFKITKDNKAEEFLKLPANPDTGRFGPMGLRVAASGDLYLADNQLFHDKDPKKFLYGKSRLVRIAMKDGKPGDMTVVASGLNVANGIAIQGDYVYLTETILKPESKPLVSGVFRFKMGEEGIVMKEPLADDPHLVLTLESENKIPFGADGICFDKQGRLYVSLFADAVIYRVLLDADGKVTEKKLFAKADFMKSCDGMDYDAKTDKIYSADLVGNGVNVIDMEGKVERLAVDGDNDGSQGQLRSPSEALVRGDTIVVANMDFVIEGGVIKKYTKPATLSVVTKK